MKNLPQLIAAAQKEFEKKLDKFLVERKEALKFSMLPTTFLEYLRTSRSELADFLATQMTFAAEEAIKAVKMKFDHKNCPLPQTCVGYESALEDCELKIQEFLGE